VRSNVVFHRDWNADLYARVIESCALQPDMDILAAGDETEIGENGINLSGTD
jgi:hypothetical protein